MIITDKEPIPNRLICQSEAIVDDDTKVERTTALKDLVQLRRPPFEAEPVLTRFGFWGSDEGLVTLNRSDALRLLDRFQQASLTALECQHWAQTLEMRDDLSLEPGAEDLLTQFLFEIATQRSTNRSHPSSSDAGKPTSRTHPADNLSSTE